MMGLLFSVYRLRSVLLVGVVACFLAMLMYVPESVNADVPSGDVVGVDFVVSSMDDVLPSDSAECESNKTFDVGLAPPLSESIGRVVPAHGEVISDSAVFVWLNFHGVESEVTINMMRLNGEDVVDRLKELDDNRFVYDQPPIGLGCHVVEVEVQDDAGDSFEFAWTFEIRDMIPFRVPLYKGWNLISFPSYPVDNALESVFAVDEVAMVVTFYSEYPDRPWRVSIRDEDGKWGRFGKYDALTKVYSFDGYWVYSTDISEMQVDLAIVGSLYNISSGGRDIRVRNGWNLVGVGYLWGGMIEGQFGDALSTRNLGEITADMYLADYSLAYRWDAEDKQFVSIDKDDFMRIGDGIWAYYEERIVTP